jgi:hypothetical protein
MTIREALTEYLILSTQVSDMENADCTCADFYTCENCHKQSELRSRLRYHLSLFAERYADELAKREGMLTEVDV